MRIVTYEQAVKYLEGFIGKIRFEITPEFLKHHDPLERMRVLLSLLGNPQNKFLSVLIGGTSGKGSTAYLISHILTTAGYKTGLTISPHLQKINERLQINRQPISDGKFTKMVGSIVDTIELMKKMQIGAPSYFEIMIAMAFKYFAEAKVDIAVVEVGMGGEFDATNTLYPLVAVLTNVSLDHTNVLGGTVQKIARTKAGIIKKLKVDPSTSSGGKLRNNPQPSTLNSQLIVVTGVRQPSVIKVVEDRCKEVGAKLYRLHKDFDFKIKKVSRVGSIMDLIFTHDREVKLNNLWVRLIGKYQVENASLAIETVLQLRELGFVVSEDHIRKALKTAFFPGRFEILKCHPEFILPVGRQVSGSPARRQVLLQSNEMLNQAAPDQHDKEKTLVLDGAHNPTKMKAFLTTLKKLYPKERKIFVVGFKFDKDVKKMLKQIVQVADTLIVTEFQGKTDMSVSASTKAESIKYQVLSSKYKGEIAVEKNSRKALDLALNIAVSEYPNIDSIIVATGSLYLVGEIRNML